MPDIVERVLEAAGLRLDTFSTPEVIGMMRQVAEEVMQLRAEVEKGAQRLSDFRARFGQMGMEQGRLQDEIERLRADNADLRRDLEIWRRNGGDDLMRAEIEQLRSLLRELVEWSNGSQQYVWQKARSTLEQKRSQN